MFETQVRLSRGFAVTAVAELVLPRANLPSFCARAIGAPSNPAIPAAAASHINRASASKIPRSPMVSASVTRAVSPNLCHVDVVSPDGVSAGLENQ